MEVILERSDEFSVLRLNRPEVLNALNASVMRQISAAFDEVVSHPSRALLITGTGDRAFCAGADIKEISADPHEHQRMVETGQSIVGKLDRLPMPSVAVINGFALGGGLEIALSCTFRVAAPAARMGLPEVKLGLLPGYGGTQRLPRLIGENRALEMIMTGRLVPADEALRIGLVNRVIDDDLMPGAKAYAREFCGYSLPGLRIIRSAVSRGIDTPLHEGLKIEADLCGSIRQLGDADEGIAAFVDKRKPEFRDA